MKKSYTIESLIKMVKDGEFILPEIQREFVWDLDRVAEFWDSIFYGYPVGQLLFWKTNTKIPAYSFFDNTTNEKYLFVTKRPRWTHKIQVDDFDGKTIVLDGQQRLTSLLLGVLDEGVTTKTRINSDDKKQYLCISLRDIDEDTEDKPKIFEWHKDEEGDDYVSIAKALDSRRQNKNIRILKDRLRSTESAIPVDYVVNKDVDEVVEIFRRLNNNGRNMNKSELFLAMWFGSAKAADLKKDLVELRELFGKDFDVQDSTVTQLMKIIFGKTSESLNKTSYSPEMFREINKNLPRLKRAIKYSVKFLHRECGIYSNSEMVSHSLFVPIVHVFYNFKSNVPDKIRAELRCFIYRSLVFGLFSKSTNSVLLRMKNTIKDLSRDDSFIEKLHPDIKTSIFADYDTNKSQWLDGEISDLLDIKKGSRSNLILLLLRQEPANVERDMFDQDHLIAADLFDETSFKALKEDVRSKFGIRVNGKIVEEWKLTEQDLSQWAVIAKENKDKKDMLPNLWLLEASRNRKKGKVLLNIWYHRQSECQKEVFWQEIFLKRHDEDYLKITNFDNLFNERRESLRKKLEELLALPK